MTAAQGLVSKKVSIVLGSYGSRVSLSAPPPLPSPVPPLRRFDRAAPRPAGHPPATAIIVTNGDDLGELKMLAEGDVLAGTPLFKF